MVATTRRPVFTSTRGGASARIAVGAARRGSRHRAKSRPSGRDMMLLLWQGATPYRRTRGRDGLFTASFEAATGHATEGVPCPGRGYRRWEGWCDSGTTGAWKMVVENGGKW